jgi:small subunit ribosomal protein S14
MAKLSSINKNNKRIKLADKFYKKREKLKKIVMDKKLPLEEKIQSTAKIV